MHSLAVSPIDFRVVFGWQIQIYDILPPFFCITSGPDTEANSTALAGTSKKLRPHQCSGRARRRRYPTDVLQDLPTIFELTIVNVSVLRQREKHTIMATNLAGHWRQIVSATWNKQYRPLIHPGLEWPNACTWSGSVSGKWFSVSSSGSKRGKFWKLQTST